MIDANGRCLRNTGAADSGVFQLDRTDPLAARFDNVFHAVRNLHGSIRMDQGNVACIKPLLCIGRIGFCLEIAFDDPWPADLQRAVGLAIAGGNIAILVYHAQFDTEGDAALFGDNINLRVEVHFVPARNW